MVFTHDRVGRMVDAQLFEDLAFPRDRFGDELLEELANNASRSVTITETDVIFHHIYTERKVYPLDLYIEEMSRDLVTEAVLDYGNAIKDLAVANIFPGDLFTKNFGVTRHGSVVFYDYDELTFLDEMNFRSIPQARTYEDEISSEPWFTVGADDVFPEEFKNSSDFQMKSAQNSSTPMEIYAIQKCGLSSKNVINHQILESSFLTQSKHVSTFPNEER